MWVQEDEFTFFLETQLVKRSLFIWTWEDFKTNHKFEKGVQQYEIGLPNFLNFNRLSTNKTDSNWLILVRLRELTYLGDEHAGGWIDESDDGKAHALNGLNIQEWDLCSH